jgi:hypothetical protein
MRKLFVAMFMTAVAAGVVGCGEKTTTPPPSTTTTPPADPATPPADPAAPADAKH